RRGRLLIAGIDPDAIARTNRSYLMGPIVYGIATVVAPVNAFLSLAIYAALAGYWLLPATGPRAMGPSPAGGVPADGASQAPRSSRPRSRALSGGPARPPSTAGRAGPSH